MRYSSSLGKFTSLLCCAALGAELAPSFLHAQEGEDAVDHARALVAQHRYSDADQVLQAYMKLHPASAAAHYLLGYSLFSQQKANESLAEYTIASRYRKPTAADLMAIAADYILLKDHQDADKWLTEVTRMEPGNELAWYYLGRAQFYEQQFNDAISTFRKCLELSPHDVRAGTNLGLALQGAEREEEAITAFHEAIEWNEVANGSDAQPYLDLGMLLRKRGKTNEAVTYLERAAVKEPNNPKTHEELGRVYEELHRLSDAESELRKAIQLAPDSSGLHFTLGRVLKHEGKDSDAAAEFTTTRKMNGTQSSKEVPNFNLKK